MNMRQTHTYAVLEVPAEVYQDIRQRLADAGYDHAFHGRNESETIDMHGIALRSITPAEPVTKE